MQICIFWIGAQLAVTIIARICEAAEVLGTAVAPASETANPSTAEIREIAANAYIFAYPLVLMDATRRTELERRAQAGSPGANRFVHAQAFPDGSQSYRDPAQCRHAVFDRVARPST